MRLDEGKRKFIDSWGELGINWGVCKSMGQIQGLLLVTKDPLCSEQIMDELQMSRGCVNVNIRALLDWELAHKRFVQGDRKEYFVAEKDAVKMLQSVVRMRKRKELDPMLKILDQISTTLEPKCDDSKEFLRVVKDLNHFSKRAESVLSNMSTVEESWLFGTFMKQMR